MHRTPLIAQLQDYQELFVNEKATIDRLLAFVNGEIACFERQTRAGHITGSAWVENADRSSVLLLLHRKLGRWLQPGGHADGDPNVRNVALREAEEETGLTDLEVDVGIFDIDIHKIPARGTEPEHWHYDVRYRMTTRSARQAEINHESLDLKWYSLVEVAAWDHQPSVSRMARKSLNHRLP